MEVSKHTVKYRHEVQCHWLTAAKYPPTQVFPYFFATCGPFMFLLSGHPNGHFICHRPVNIHMALSWVSLNSFINSIYLYILTAHTRGWGDHWSKDFLQPNWRLCCNIQSERAVRFCWDSGPAFALSCLPFHLMTLGSYACPVSWVAGLMCAHVVMECGVSSVLRDRQWLVQFQSKPRRIQ